MIKSNKKLFNMTAIAIIFIMITYAIRMQLLIFKPDHTLNFVLGHVRTIIYLVLLVIWGISLRHRIIQFQTKRYMSSIVMLMIFWLTVRTCKFYWVTSVCVDRYLWYSYYVAILFIPLLTLFVAMSLGKPEDFHLPKQIQTLTCFTIALLLLVITNDFHQFVFVFRQSPWSDSSYSYNFGYWVIIIWQITCALFSIKIILKKCRIPESKKILFLPLVPLTAIIIYGIFYIFEFPWLRFWAGDMTIIECLFIITTLESCIRCNLIQNNSHYKELFATTIIPVIIVDNNYNEYLSSYSYFPISIELMKKAQTSPVIISNKYRLSSLSIKNGTAFWLDDISKLSEILDELEDKYKYLSLQKDMLQKEVATRKKERRLVEGNRLFNAVMKQTKNELLLYSNLIEKLDKTDDPIEIKKLATKLAIVCTHIKRRSNLVLLAENNDNIEPVEIYYAINEWLVNIRLNGTVCTCNFALQNYLHFSQIIALYNSFQEVILFVVDNLNSLFINAFEEDDQAYLLLYLNCQKDLSTLDIPYVDIVDEDNHEWVLKITIPKGGYNSEVI